MQFSFSKLLSMKSSHSVMNQPDLFNFASFSVSKKPPINAKNLPRPKKVHGAYEDSSYGGIYGALDPTSERAEAHANRYYGLVRSMTNDFNRIAHNTGFRPEDIQRVKDHIFKDAHNLGDGKIDRFDPSYKMGQSWQRLMQGKDIQPHDITLLNHEFLESIYMKDGLSYNEAHIKAEKIYNYNKEAVEYNKRQCH